ncbi:MAG TPA: sigma 54-interacting transcriptional regulator [Symbiobacteriaceae bacterium]|nr:sigma 54-interacting transcriptional regulator [Symbiobacteriaceae bacterium]
MPQIACIAPYRELGDLAQKVGQELGEEIEVLVGRIRQGVHLAQEAQRSGAEVIVSRGVTAWMIARAGLGIPVVDVPITGYDLLRAYVAAKSMGQPVGILDVEEVLCGVAALEEILGERIVKIQLKDQTRIDAGIQELKATGVAAVFGKIAMVKLARKHSMRGVVITSGEEAVNQALREAGRILEVRKLEKQNTQRLKAVIDFSYDGVVAVDAAGMVTAFNPVAETITGIPSSQALGRSITQLIPGSRLPAVIDCGSAELGEMQEIGRVQVVTNRVPIIVGGKVHGAVATFQEVSRLQKLEQKIRQRLQASGHIAKYSFRDITGESRVIADVIAKADRFGRVDSTVLIEGETGTGKERFAHAIHRVSPKAAGPFVAVNCGALQESLLESELFGYVEGAFTGARKGGKEGLFELAHGGTIFLDEVSEMSESLQAKVLRVIQEHEVMRIGDDRIIPVDVRIIAATNRSLKGLVASGAFREDLYYRINVLHLRVPPLRERVQDIPLLVQSFLGEFNRRFGKEITAVERAGMDILCEYLWPGNVRELRNIVERMVILTEGCIVRAGTVSESLQDLRMNDLWQPAAAVPNSGSSFDTDIREALAKSRGNKGQAARILGIGRTTLWRRLKEMNEQ